MNRWTLSKEKTWNMLFVFIAFLLYTALTIALFHERIPDLFTHYAMPDIDTDGGLWYQWYLHYIKENKLVYDITTIACYPFGCDIAFAPIHNLVYTTQLFILQHILGFSWQTLIFITNISSLITYPFSAIGAYLLCYYITKNKIGSLLAGLVFGFSFYHVYMGRGQMSINHTELIPFYFLSLLYFLNKKTLSSLILSVLTFSILFQVDAYYAFFSGLFSVFILLFYKRESMLQKMKIFFMYYMFLALTLILTNFNFVISNLYLFNQSTLVQSGRGTTVRNELTDIEFFFTPPNIHFLHEHAGPLGYFIYMVPILLAILGLLLLKKNRLYVVCLLCFLLAVVLSAYIPALYLLNILYFNFFAMFRSIGRVILPGYLFLGLMVGMAVSQLMKTDTYTTLRKKYAYFNLILILVGICIIFNGIPSDNTWSKSTNFSKIAALYEPIKNNEDITNIVVYPSGLNFNDVGFPQTYQLLGQIIHNKPYANGADLFSQEGRNYQKKIRDISDKKTIDYLRHYGIDTIIIYNKILKNASDINDQLKNDSRVVFIGRYTQTRDKGYLSANELSRDISVYQIKKAVLENKEIKPLFYNVTFDSPITYEKKESYKYFINMTNITSPTTIVFNAPYSQKWQMYLGSITDNNISFMTDTHTALGNNQRFNEYLNSWIINPNYIKANVSKEHFRENPDGSINMQLTLFFKPQAVHSLGNIISVITFSSYMVILVIIWVRDKYRKELRA